MKRALPIALAAAAACVAARSATADISGFGEFAPINSIGSSPFAPGYSADGSALVLTQGYADDATSVFNAVAQNVSSFTASFNYTCAGNDENPQYVQGDGFDFVVQNDARGVAAIGGIGGGKGYQAGTSPTVAAITPSVAIGFELYGTQSVSYLARGVSQTTANLTSTGSLTALNGGDPIVAHVSYSARTLSVSLFELSTEHFSYLAVPNVDLPSLVGGTNALVGFTAGTGDATAIQTLRDVSMSSGRTYQPIPLAASSFNQDMVVEASSPTSNAAGAITATMDAGTAKTGSTYYEQGYDPAHTTYNGLPTGLPKSGGTFTSQADPNHVFQMPSYAGDNALLLDAANGIGTLTFATPRALSSLSFLVAAGHGPAAFTFVINYADGAPSSNEFFSDDVVSPDWFDGGSVAWDADGRAYPTAAGATTYDSIGSGAPSLFQEDLNLPDATDPIASVQVFLDVVPNAQVAIFAVSGVAVPEPTAAAALVAAAAGLTARGRRRGRGRRVTTSAR